MTRSLLASFTAVALVVCVYGVHGRSAQRNGSPVYSDALASLLDRGPGGREIIGMGAPYEPTITTPDTVNQNMATRREVAWTAVAKVFAPYEVTLTDGTTDTIPAFLSWYIETEINAIMKEMVDEFGFPTESPGFTSQQVLDYLNGRGKRLREGPRDFEPIPLDVLERLGNGIPAHAGTTANLFSPSFVTHILEHIREIADCSPDDMVDYIQEKLDGVRESFSPCMSNEFPSDAVMFKPRWTSIIADDIVPMPSAPTNPDTMRRLLGEPQTGESRLTRMPTYDPLDPSTQVWSETPTNPDPSNVENFFVIENSAGRRYALRSLHVVTKEVDEWVWGTIWWSATPGRDFGLDRPDTLQESLGNYKLCAATTFMEQDQSSPAERFQGMPELATVMRHVTWPDGPMQTEDGTASWCANPYIEGLIPARTCAGCHQAAGELGPGPDGNVRRTTRHLGDFVFTFERLWIKARTLAIP